jgi:hypothetical protein
MTPYQQLTFVTIYCETVNVLVLPAMLPDVAVIVVVPVLSTLQYSSSRSSVRLSADAEYWQNLQTDNLRSGRRGHQAGTVGLASFIASSFAAFSVDHCLLLM